MPQLDRFRYHAEQQRLWSERKSKRFQVVAAGRRSGKTELSKRKIVEAACDPPNEHAMYFCGAPTYAQVKRIYWDDMVSMLAPITLEVNKTDLTIRTVLGSSVTLIGLDKPERVEGVPWSGCIVTEAANIKPEAWASNILPALDTPGIYGWATLEGVPEGRNWYHDLVKAVQAGEYGDNWGYYHWISADILPPEIIEQAKRNLDELTYEQEYEASFVNFAGSCYYGWSEANIRPMAYDYGMPLHLCFDFNVSPGVAIAIQQHDDGDYVVDEIHIPRNSNTELVCNRLIDAFGAHEHPIYLYGDATGEARRTSGLYGSDWHIIKNMLTDGIPGARIIPRVPPSNPRERARVNAVNSRLKDGCGDRHFYVDPHCVNTVRDFEGVQVDDDGRINKKDRGLSHITDAIGYYLHTLYPISSYDPAGAVTGRVVVGDPNRF